MKKEPLFLDKISTLPFVIISFIIFIALYLIINSKPFGLAQLIEISGGVSIPDMEFNHSSLRFYDIITSLGNQGREFYLGLIFKLDFLFPLSYAFFYSSALGCLIKGLNLNSPIFRYLPFVGILAGLSDWLENIFTLILLFMFPVKNILIADIAGFFTNFKFVLIMTCMVLIIILLIILIVKKLFYIFIKRKTD